MHGRRSLNLELTPLDLDLERNIRRACRAQTEMGDNQRNPRKEQHEEHQRKEQHEEHQRRRTRSFKMQELGTGSIDMHMSWISLRHFGNCSHLQRSVHIRALCYHRLMPFIMI
jgi:hypothetical protein